MTIIWKDFSSWDQIIRDTLGATRASDVVSKMKKAGEGGYVSDDPEWLTPLKNILVIQSIKQ
jgi:hypothetical protein